jgi:hypothetical protein
MELFPTDVAVRSTGAGPSRERDGMKPHVLLRPVNAT